MEQNYNKVYYDSHPGYRLHHTYGACAGESTLPYTHYNINFMLIYFIHGTGNIKIEGRHYDIEAGDIIILNPTELYHCTVDVESYHERIVLYINESILRNFPYDCSELFMSFHQRKRGLGNRIPAHITAGNHLDLELQSLLQLAKAPDTTSAVLSICKVIEILARLNQIVMPLYISNLNNRERANENPLINNVLNYINNHFTEELHIADIAIQFNLDQSYLSHLFTEHVGMSLWNYVIFRRLYLFNDLIRTNHSIEETCYQAGFQNYSNFFRLYKKYMKMTPLQFKRKMQSTRKDLPSHPQSDIT